MSVQESVGVNVLVQSDGVVIGAQTDATLNIPQELREIITKQENNFVSHLQGKQEWSISSDSFVLDDTDDVFIANGRATLEFSFDDGTTFTAFPRLQDIDLELTQNLAERSALDLPNWRYLLPAERLWTIETSGIYFKPEEGDGSGGLQNTEFGDILDAKQNDERADVKLTIDTMTLEGEVALGDVEITGSTGGETAGLSISYGGNGELTKTGSLDPKTDKLFDLYFSQTRSDTIIEINDFPHYWQGNAYASSVSVSITDGEEITASLSLEGDGPIEQFDGITP